MNLIFFNFTVHFISIKPVFSDHLSYVILFNNMDRDHIFGIESVCDRQVSEIIDIFYGDTETKEDRILTSQEFTKLAQRQVIKCLLKK
jgi:hypothetical protein